MHFVFLIYSSNKNSLDVRDGSRMNIHRYGYRLLEQPQGELFSCGFSRQVN